MNDTLTIFNSISCLGRHVILLTDSLEEYKSLESENEYNCMNVFFDDDETNKNTQIQNNEMKVYKKILKTKDGNITQIEDRSEEHTSELQSRENLVCRLL